MCVSLCLLHKVDMLLDTPKDHVLESAEMAPKDHVLESAEMAPKDHVLEKRGLLGRQSTGLRQDQGS